MLSVENLVKTKKKSKAYPQSHLTETPLLIFGMFYYVCMGFPGGSVVKNLPANARDTFDPWVGKIPWRRKMATHSNNSCLGNPMDRRAWRPTEELMPLNWCWRRFLRVPWTARRSNQSILKDINPKYALEG